MPYKSKEQRRAYMQAYRKKQKEKPKHELALEETNPWKELEVLLGHPLELHKSKRGFVHAHISKEDIAKIEANTPYGRKVAP